MSLSMSNHSVIRIFRNLDLKFVEVKRTHISRTAKRPVRVSAHCNSLSLTFVPGLSACGANCDGDSRDCLSCPAIKSAYRKRM
jgi:hypothetical protein